MDTILDKHLNELIKKDWMELYHIRGMTLTEIAKHFGVSAKTISIRMNNFGVKRRGYGRVKVVSIEENVLRDLYLEKKYNFSRIGRILGVVDSTVKKYINEYNIPIRKRPKEILTKELLCTLFTEKGKNATAIAKITGVSVPIVLRYLRRFGFEVKPGNRYSLTEEQENIIVSLYLEGKTSVEIAKFLNLTTLKVFNVLAKAKIKTRGSNEYSYRRVMPPDAVVVAMYVDEKMSIGQIAKKAGGSKTSVQRILEKNKVLYRTKSESKKGIRNNMYEVKHSIKAREKMSQVYSDEVREIGINFGRGNAEQVKTVLQGMVTVRSSWEGAVIRYFNKKGFKYLYEPTTLALRVDGVETSYKPDFLMLFGPGIKEEFYLEVKGLWNDTARAKVKAARKVGHNIVVWEGKDLQEKGILDNSFRPLF